MYFSVENLTVRFGGLIAVDQVSFEVKQGQIMSLVGPNGAGKTTVFNALTGFGPFETGSVIFKGENILGKRPVDIAKLGVTRSFQKTHVFQGMTVLENIVTARNMMFKTGFWANILYLPGVGVEEKGAEAAALEILEFFGLAHLKEQMADSLSYGDARFLGVAVAFATGAELLLLDEPAAGLNPVDTDRLMEILLTIKKLGKTILLIEHDMKMVMTISDWVTVVCFGKKISEGTPSVVANCPEVIEAYLGSGAMKVEVPLEAPRGGEPKGDNPL